MSCCFKWISKKLSHSTEVSTDNAEKPACPFENIPADILVKILGDREYLSVEDLKSARLVCKLWHVIISEIQLLAKKSLALTFKGDTSLMRIKYSRLIPKESRRYWIFAPRIFRRKIPIHGSTFRIQNSGAHLVFDWLRFFKAKNITSLEIDFSNLSLNLLTSCISACFKKLESLTLTGETFIPDPQNLSGKVNKLIQPTFQNLKSLTIEVTHPWIYGILGDHRGIVPVPNFLTTPFINCLVTFNIKVTDAGTSAIDELGHFQTIFKSVGLILKNNAETLKNVSIVTYDVLNDRCYKCYTSYPDIPTFPNLKEAPSEEENFLFECFLEEMKASGWIEYGLLLKKLTLAFRLMHLRRSSNIVNDTFKPFLNSMSSLQEISVSQIFTRNREYFDEIFGRFFTCRKCHFVEIYALNPDTEWDNELQGPLQFYLVQNHPEFLASFYQEFKEEQKFMTDIFIAQDVYRSWDVSSELTTRNIKWIVRFPAWNSLRSVEFFKNYINFLTRIKIQHGAQLKSDKLVIEDEDLQTIFRYGKMLIELYIQHCNLFRVTDYGLTGISLEGRNRMYRTKIRQPESADVVGVPLSNLKRLRSFQLGDAGPAISSFSVIFGFKGLNKMDSFQMQFLHNPTAAVPPLEFDFPCTREIKPFPTFQYETYENVKL